MLLALDKKLDEAQKGIAAEEAKQDDLLDESIKLLD